MRVFQFRDLTPIEAFVLARDYDRAAELFRLHLLAHGGDPDALLYREWPRDDLGPPERTAVFDALRIDREGLITCSAAGRWTFATPAGDQKHDDAR